jgi:hypothetical protein
MTPERVDLSRAVWQKSSYSGGNGGQCVEVAINLPGVVAIRDSKRPEDGAHIIERAAFAVFLDDVKAGEFSI